MHGGYPRLRMIARMTDVLQDIEDWTSRGERVAVATVVAVARSAPMPPGTKMAVSDSGSVVGLPCGGEIDIWVERWE